MTDLSTIAQSLKSQLLDVHASVAARMAFIDTVLATVDNEELVKCSFFKMPPYMGSFSAPNKWNKQGTVTLELHFGDDKPSWAVQSRELVAIRRTFGVTSWSREMSEYSMVVYYRGTSKHGYNVVLTVHDGGLPPTCKVVESETYVPGHIQKTYKTVCE